MFKLIEIPNLKSVAFPYKIGCGYGGGIWEQYLESISQLFSKKSSEIDISIYKLDSKLEKLDVITKKIKK